jgi:5-methylcytosine-specific restriction enzyme A
MLEGQYKLIQDMWAQGADRFRWSVAFPIIESYKIVDRPKAKEVLGDELYRKLYQRSSATLRVLSDEDRAAIADLELTVVNARSAWIGIEDEVRFAERSEVGSRTKRLIAEDLGKGAMEGMTAEKQAQVRLRAAWLADKFIRYRKDQDKLICDECGFDPRDIFEPQIVSPRTLLDVHHKNPLDEGVRYTNLTDFALLCPTCHRIEHQRLKIAQPRLPDANFTVHTVHRDMK